MQCVLSVARNIHVKAGRVVRPVLDNRHMGALKQNRKRTFRDSFFPLNIEAVLREFVQQSEN